MSRIVDAEPAPPLRDYYAVLGLSVDAEGAEVGAAYWRLARQYHARASGYGTGLDLLQQLNEAAEVLGTPESRQRYDALRDAAYGTHLAEAAAPERDEPVGTITRAPTPRASVALSKRLSLLFVMFGVLGLASTAAASNIAVRGVSVSSAQVIFLGDSVTRGAGASSGGTAFASLLQRRLQAAQFASSPEDYDSVISALGGQLVDLRYAQDIARQPRSMIVVEVGAHSVVEDAKLSAQQFGDGYGLMLDCLLGSGATVVVATVPWLAWDRSDPAYALAAERSDIIRVEAGMRGLPVADIWSGTKDRPELVSEDNFHPNDAGHRVIADLLWEQIAPRLTQPRGTFGDHCGYDGVLALRSAQAEATARAAARD